MAYKSGYTAEIPEIVPHSVCSRAVDRQDYPETGVEEITPARRPCAPYLFSTDVQSRRIIKGRSLWVRSHSRFFLPIPVLRKVFRRKFVSALKRNFRQGKLGFHGTLKPLAHPKAFSAWLRTLDRHDWHVYSKRPFGGAEQALRYLGHYTHRVAISNHRLVSFVDHQVTFRWRDRAHHNEPKLMTLSLDEFLRRFLLHLLPRGFVRIRHFGFLANRRRATLLPLCFQLLGPIPQPQIEPAASATEQPTPLCRCPKCGGTMVIIQTLTAAQILLRSPASFLSAA